ncbi:MAG TPA: hypothetical protein VF390_02645 [Patescibacteria group bacterium]
MDSTSFDIPPRQDRSAWQRKIPWPIFIGTILLFSLFTVWLVRKSAARVSYIQPVLVKISYVKKEKAVLPSPPKKVFIPGPFSMETIKKKGCVGDGLLSGAGGNTERTIALIERSRCQYIHRALETWMDDPDLKKAADTMASFDKPGMVFGMFLSEAINKRDKYKDKETGQEFDFMKMCDPNSDGTWGFNSCKASFDKEEYRNYIKYITKKAMDIGIQSFLFGQIFYQNEKPLSESKLPGIIKGIRSYAKEKGLQIVIGAQTNSITDEKYLKLFDYIEGGVGIDSQGNIENGPCWSQKESCWALLWHDQFRTKANNVILNLDWSGIQNDDMSVFARMDQDTRKKTLNNLYSYFTSRDMGFMMPFLAPLYKDNGGCYGPKKRFYSPDNRYKCQDENAINAILGAGK